MFGDEYLQRSDLSKKTELVDDGHDRVKHLTFEWTEDDRIVTHGEGC